MLLAIIDQFDLELEQKDVKQCFCTVSWRRRYTRNSLKVIFRKIKKIRCDF